MAKKPKNLVHKYVLPFLSAYDVDTGPIDLEEIQVMLHLLAKHENSNAAQIFKKSYKDDISEILANQHHDYHRILSHFINQEQHEAYLIDYRDWLSHQHISNNLLHFLEYLSHKKHHRLRYFIKCLNHTNPPANYLHYYILGACMSVIAPIPFIAHPEWAHICLAWLTQTAPQISLWLLENILLPQNLSLIVLTWTSIWFMQTLFYIYYNRSTDQEHKISKFTQYTLAGLLSITAQLLCYFNQGYISPIAANFSIASALILSFWSILYPPNALDIQPNKDMDPKERETYLTDLNYQEQKKFKFYVNSVYFILITLMNGIGLYYLNTIPVINLLSIASQFLLGLVKSTIEAQIDDHHADRLQNLFADEAQNNLMPSPSL